MQPTMRRRALRVRGSGTGASTMNDPALATDEELAALFDQLDVDRSGLLPVEDLVQQAKAYFDSRPTSQPEEWIRAMIVKADTDADGMLDLAQYSQAVELLRRC
jgi:Ca2+-binding EF-hand superfamily protein